jgi:hypothetical protein
MKRALLSLPLLFAIGLAAGCEIDIAPAGLRRTPEGNGPLVKFDPTHRPLPDVPLPNDVATFADPTSRTGRRLDLSIAAPTSLDRRTREGLSTMEGWGVTSPITVAFERSAPADPREPAIDLDAVVSRMEGDEHDPSNDPFYVVNLATGLPAFVDVESGYYPVTVRDPWRYGPGDPKASEPNLLFETTEEGAGLPQSAYRPELDRDFDGVLDHPNTRKRRGAFAKPPIPGVDDLLTWYERETDTLILRPILPLEEKTEYAVVLTDRLRGPNGQPIRSPFEAIHHPSQVAGVTRLRDWLTDKRRANYYGDIAGTGLEHVAFAWTFTTQPTHEDMQLLRDGLYGSGPFARWKDEFPAELTVARAAGVAPASQAQPPGWDSSSDACKRRAKTPWILRPGDPDALSPLRRIFADLFPSDAGSVEATERAMAYVDHVVVGSFQSPYLLGDPSVGRVHLDFRTGAGTVTSDEVQWVLVVPKAKGDKQQPFPVAVWGHGEAGHAGEALLFGGDYARQGIAVVAYNAPGHGLVLSEADRSLAEAEVSASCIAPFLGAVTGRRARDTNGDGIDESGRLSWTADVFRSRDAIRQGVLDGLQLLRALRSFDGRIGKQDFTGDGAPDVAGDFDGDGVPDVGGPNVPYFAAGRSLGGVTSAIAGGVEPWVIATAPIAGATLGPDGAMRSYGVADSVVAQLMGPFVFAVPAEERSNRGEAEGGERLASRCSAGQRTVRIQMNEGTRSQELELDCLDPAELSAEMTVVLTNVSSGETRCARTDRDGRFRIPIPTSGGDKLDIQVYTAPDVVASYDGCRIEAGAPVGRRIKLVAPNDGLGLRRQSPELRRFRDLAQAALDPADPIAFAPYYALEPLLDESGTRSAPHALLEVNTVGDNFAPVAAGLSFARAAGALPFLPPGAAERLPEYADYATPPELYDRLGRRTPMRFLVESGVVEGVSRLARTSAGPGCAPNISADATMCTSAGSIEPYECQTALFDPDWVSEGRLSYDEPHPEAPLRLARVATVRVTDGATLAAAWEPRLRGVPFGPDEAGWTASERVLGLLDQYIAPSGRHAWASGDACRAWDYATYGNALIARFFATGGRDLYYLSHPKTHGCLVDGTCAFLQ